MFLRELRLQCDRDQDKDDDPAGVEVDRYPEDFADQQSRLGWHVRLAYGGDGVFLNGRHRSRLTSIISDSACRKNVGKAFRRRDGKGTETAVGWYVNLTRRSFSDPGRIAPG